MPSKQEITELSLYSLPKLEVTLGIRRDVLRQVARRASVYYEPFFKTTKPLPFQRKRSKSKTRTIDNPIEPLKGIQERINGKLLSPIRLPSYICGGVRGKTVLHNVALHLGAKCLVTVDIRDFFPSITNKHVYYVWRNVLDCSSEISALLTQLTSVNHHLPQGAGTSTMLSNLVLYSIDEPIRAKCKELDIKYSTWVDDLAFSGECPQKVIGLVVQTMAKNGFRLSRKKIRVMGPGSRKVLNGVLMNKHPNVLPERLSQIRSGIHKLRTGQVAQSYQSRYVRSLEGRIAHVQTINPRKGAKLRTDLDEVKAMLVK